MARELEQFFLPTPATTPCAPSSSPVPAARSAPAWTSPPRATSSASTRACSPRPRSSREHYDQAPFHDGLRDTGGRVTLAIHALPKPVIAADQRPRGRHRRHDDPGHGHAPGLDQGPDRVRLRSPRHRAGGRARLVPAPHRRHPAGPGVGLLRRHPHRRAGARRPAGALGARARRPAARRPGAGPLLRRRTARRPRSAWPSSCSTATAPRPTRSRRTCPTAWRCSAPRSATARRAWPRSSRSAHPQFTGSAPRPAPDLLGGPRSGRAGPRCAGPCRSSARARPARRRRRRPSRPACSLARSASRAASAGAWPAQRRRRPPRAP